MIKNFALAALIAFSTVATFAADAKKDEQPTAEAGKDAAPTEKKAEEEKK